MLAFQKSLTLSLTLILLVFALSCVPSKAKSLVGSQSSGNLQHLNTFNYKHSWWTFGLTLFDEAPDSKPDLWAWWKKLRSFGTGWIVAFLLFILLILRNVIQDFLKSAGQKAINRVYDRLAGHRVLRRTALRRYRRALVRKYHKLKVAFRPDRPLDISEIYVPLKVRDPIKRRIDSTVIRPPERTLDPRAGEREVDAFSTMIDHRRLMVVGLPGSGKSMLLKHIALTYADGGLDHLQDDPVPVLIELNRLNESENKLKETIVDIFRFNDFPNAGPFVDLSLKQGRLMLLFDGLDEVNSDKRTQVVRVIKDLLDEFSRCRAIITCRTAVYRDEFNQTVDQTLEIVEFNDQQIHIFLKSWQSSMPREKSVEQLLRTLRERPKIMALARNPLLLTLIAFLYSDTDFQLPHSRTEFYDKAVDFLLFYWKVEVNKYRGSQKRLILQHLALFNQDGAKGAQDRRSIELRVILEQIKIKLPELNLREEEADKLLDEIVERSSLLLSIDGGIRYQFAHLTLQEFFAADALRNDPEGLLKRYLSDRETWIEAIKLWCGLDLDSTGLIKAIYETDQLTAFECLADAQMVNASLAYEIIHDFKPRLANSANITPILKAFAAVASDKRPRGQDVFHFLAESVQFSNNRKVVNAAITALSYTNMPAAAEMFATLYRKDSAVQPALVWMGDIAVPFLFRLAEEGSSNALDDLQAIGTPEAARALVPFLWSPKNKVALSCAFRLASLTNRPNVEDTLRECEISKELLEGGNSYLKGIWDPFDQARASPLSIIMGRVAYLIDDYAQSPGAAVENPVEAKNTIDSRVVVPLLVQTQASRMVSPQSLAQLYQPNRNLVILLEQTGRYVPNAPKAVRNFNSLNQLLRTSLEVADVNKVRTSDDPGRSGLDESASVDLIRLIAAVIRELFVIVHAKPIARLLNLVPPRTQIELFQRVVREPVPTMADWQNIFRPVKFRFKSSWHFRLVSCIAIGISIFSLVGLIYSPNFLSEYFGHGLVLTISIISFAITWMGLLKLIKAEQYDSERWYPFGLIIFMPLAFLLVHIARLAEFAATVFEQPRPKSKIAQIILLIIGLTLVCCGWLLGAEYPASGAFLALVGLLVTFWALMLRIDAIRLSTVMPQFRTFGDTKEMLITTIQAVAFATTLLIVFYGSFVLLLSRLSVATSLLVWLLVLIGAFELCRKGLTRDRAGRNPLHGLFENRL